MGPLRATMAPPRTSTLDSCDRDARTKRKYDRLARRGAGGLLALSALALIRSSDESRKIFSLSFSSSYASLEDFEECERRRLQSGYDAPCTPKPSYVSVDDAKRSMPRIERRIDRADPPSHVKLCRELIKRDELFRSVAEARSAGKHVKAPAVQMYEIEEAVEVCMDWNAPHASLMDIYASSVVGMAGSAYNMAYTPNCERTREHNSGPRLKFDATSVQQALPESGLLLHPHTVDVERVVKMCKGCVEEWDQGPGRLNDKDLATRSHQCLLFPKPGTGKEAYAAGMERVQGQQQMPAMPPQDVDQQRDMPLVPAREGRMGDDAPAGDSFAPPSDDEEGRGGGLLGSINGDGPKIEGRMGDDEPPSGGTYSGGDFTPPSDDQEGVRKGGLISTVRNRAFDDAADSANKRPSFVQGRNGDDEERPSFVQGRNGDEDGRPSFVQGFNGMAPPKPPSDDTTPPSDDRRRRLFLRGLQWDDPPPSDDMDNMPFPTDGEVIPSSDEGDANGHVSFGGGGPESELKPESRLHPQVRPFMEMLKPESRVGEQTPEPRVGEQYLTPEARVGTLRYETGPDSVEASVVTSSQLPPRVQPPDAGALRAILPSVKDRLRMAALDRYPASMPHPLERESGALVYIDESSVAVPFYVYTSNIPPSVTSVHVVSSPGCAKADLEGGESCVDHGKKLRQYLTTFYPQAHVRFDVTSSTAAAFSRMIMAKILMCPPGTVSCLLPALCKDHGTIAKMVESPSMDSTYHWYQALTTTGNGRKAGGVDLNHVEVVKVGESDTSGVMIDATGDGFAGMENVLAKAPPMREDGCDQLRGKIGEWIPVDARSIPALKGVADGMQMRGADRYADDRLTGFNQHEMDEKDKEEARGRYRGKAEMVFGSDPTDVKMTYIWQETEFPTCQMDQLTLEGLCKVAGDLNLKRLFFVGDALQGQMVLSLWTLLGLPDYPGHKTMGAWNRVVDCPAGLNRGQPIEIAYVRNDDLGDNVRPVVTDTHSDFPWVSAYVAFEGRTLLVASTGAYVNDYGRFQEGISKFATSIINAIDRPNDIVVYRTAAPGHRDCEEMNPMASLITGEEFVQYNDYAVNVLNRRERGRPQWVSGARPEYVASFAATNGAQATSLMPGDAATIDGGRPLPPSEVVMENGHLSGATSPIQLLDVYPMTVLHPEGAAASPGGLPTPEVAKEKHDCSHEYIPGPPDAWNHMLYTKLVDMARKKVSTRMRRNFLIVP